MPLRHLRKAAIELLRHRELQHRVAQELEPLVVRQPLPLLVAERRVRQRLPQQVAIGKGMAEALLKIIQVGTHEHVVVVIENVAAQGTPKCPPQEMSTTGDRACPLRLDLRLSPGEFYEATTAVHTQPAVPRLARRRSRHAVGLHRGRRNSGSAAPTSTSSTRPPACSSSTASSTPPSSTPPTTASSRRPWPMMATPLDVLILSSEPVYPLTLISSRPIGVMTMVDQDELDYKIIAVGISDPEYNTYHDVHELPRHRPRRHPPFLRGLQDAREQESRRRRHPPRARRRAHHPEVARHLPRLGRKRAEVALWRDSLRPSHLPRSQTPVGNALVWATPLPS